MPPPRPGMSQRSTPKRSSPDPPSSRVSLASLRNSYSHYAFFFLMIRPPPRSTLFPYTTLFRFIAGFTGRRLALQELADLFSAEDGNADNRVVISSIAGMAGIGKSALAIRAAHRLHMRFPDGQLYVDLQGTTPGLQPLKPSEVLGRFLRALGMAPSAVPASESEASARFRSEVAGRQMLILLDNAADARQIRPLLPGSGCGVLVTSRHVLSTLDGARHLHLNALMPREAFDLLRRLVGPGRVAAEPAATVEIARLCGRLPLALRRSEERRVGKECRSRVSAYA